MHLELNLGSSASRQNGPEFFTSKGHTSTQNEEIYKYAGGTMITLDSKMNLRGDSVITESLFKDNQGIWTHRELNCHSGESMGGTCRCISHPEYMERKVKTSEAEKLTPLANDYTLNSEQFIFDCFGGSKEDVEYWLESSYNLGINPMPQVRKILPEGITVRYWKGDIRGVNYTSDILIHHVGSGKVNILTHYPDYTSLIEEGELIK